MGVGTCAAQLRSEADPPDDDGATTGAEGVTLPPDEGGSSGMGCALPPDDCGACIGSPVCGDSGHWLDGPAPMASLSWLGIVVSGLSTWSRPYGL